MTMAQVMILFYISSNRLKDQHGLTLLEMLVVVFILSAIALMTLSFTNNADDQFRFEDTRTRLEKIRIAAVGEPGRTINGGPAISGFVADMGRLPNNLQEMIEQGSLPVWGFDTGVGLWAGWHGPYLSVMTEQQSGLKAYRDGWGNSSGANYGWKTFAADQNAGTLDVVSFGSDGALGGSVYAADYPPAGFLIVRDDHQINLKGWPVTVKFQNPGDGTGPALPSVADTVRLRLYYPQDGGFGWPATWPATSLERDNAAYLSLVATLSAGVVADGGFLDVPFSFGTTDKFVPWGIRSLKVVLDADGTVYVPTPNSSKLVALIPRVSIPTGMTMEWRLE